MIWTSDVLATVISTLRANSSVTKACQELSALWQEEISSKSINCAFRRAKLGQPSKYLAPPEEIPREVSWRVWDEATVKKCIPILRRYGTVVDACREISEVLGRPITTSAIQKAFISFNRKTPVAYIDKKLQAESIKKRATLASQGNKKPYMGFSQPAAIRAKGPSSAPTAKPTTCSASAPNSDLVQDGQLGQKLLLLVQRQTRTINELADQLDVSPKVIRQTIELLQHQGYGVTLERDQIVGFSVEVVSEVKDAKALTALPGEDGTYCFGAVADTHFGSKYCDEEAFVQYVDYAYSLGVRHILHAGDILTGLLNHHGMSFEVKTLGFDNQVELALSIMPQKPGLSYFGICGNHEINSWTKSISMSPGAALVRRAHEMGRNDIHHVGDIQGRVVFGEGEQAIKVELAHPKVSGNTYAISYPVQKWVERMPGGAKPHILLSGHLHQFSILNVRNVVCVQPGCFEHSTPYTREMGLHPAVGGVIIWAKRDGLNLWFKSEWVATRTKPVDWTQIE